MIRPESSFDTVEKSADSLEANVGQYHGQIFKASAKAFPNFSILNRTSVELTDGDPIIAGGLGR